MSRAVAFLCGFVLSVVGAALAVTGGGFPSNPIFQSITATKDGQQVVVKQATANADQKNWVIRTGGSPNGAFAISTSTDAAPNTAVNNWVVCNRTGTTVTGCTLPETIMATQFTGSGAGLTSVPDSALSANVPLLNAANVFTSNNSQDFSITANHSVIRARFDATNTQGGFVLWDNTNSVIRGYMGSGAVCAGQSIADMCLAPGVGGHVIIGTPSGVAVQGRVCTSDGTDCPGTPSNGNFTATLTGCTAAQTVTATYEKRNGFVTLYMPFFTLCTSNNAIVTITGAPAAIFPSAVRVQPVATCEDNAVVLLLCAAQVDTGGVITMLRYISPSFVQAAWSATGSRAMGDFTIAYQL